MATISDLWVRGEPFASETGLKTGAALEDLVTRAVPVSSTQLLDQTTLEDFEHATLTDDDGNKLRQFRVKPGGIVAASIGVLPTFHVHKNGTDQQDLVRGAWRDVTWSTEVTDTETAFTGNQHTIKTAGFYQYGAQLSWVRPNHDWSHYEAGVAIVIDDVVSYYRFRDFASNFIQKGVDVTTPRIALTVGQVVRVQAWHTFEDTPGTHGDIDGDAAHTWFWGGFVCLAS